jgi:hypothetical protein
MYQRQLLSCGTIVSIILSFNTAVTALVAARVSYPRQLEDPAPCRFLPGDDEWPKESEWNALNNTIAGRLIRATPLAQTCYVPHFNRSECEAVRNQWVQIHE